MSIKITNTDNGIQLSGATYDRRDAIKAAGGRWDPAARVWTLPTGTDTTFLSVPLPCLPKPKVAVVVPIFGWDGLSRCCDQSRGVPISAGDVQGPWYWSCPCHGKGRVHTYMGD